MRRRKKGKYFSQQGVALLAASVAIAITGILVKEFSTNTTVDYFAAVNARDNMRAQFLTRSGANLAQMVIKVQTDFIDRYRKQLGLGDMQIGDYVGYFMGIFAGNQEEVNAVAEMVGGVDTKRLKGLGIEYGNFDLVIGTEDGKINLNCANGSQATRETLQTKLQALMWFDAYNPVFENPDAEGWRRDRNQQVSAIIDFVDRDQTKFDAPGNPEDYGYESLRDPYKARDNYLDTVEELRLVRGVDDRFWTLFGNNFTIYGDCKENIAAMTDPKQIAAVIFLSAKDPDSPIVNDPNKLWALARRVAEARGLGVYFDDANAFADFVKDPNGMMGGFFGMGGMGGQQQPTEAAQAASGLAQVEGVELDTTKLKQIVTDGPRRTYRIEVTASAGRVQRRLVAVWDTKTQNQNARSPDYARGSWVYWRLE